MMTDALRAVKKNPKTRVGDITNSLEQATPLISRPDWNAQKTTDGPQVKKPRLTKIMWWKGQSVERGRLCTLSKT